MEYVSRRPEQGVGFVKNSFRFGAFRRRSIMYKKMVWLAVLALALPFTAFASSIDISNAGGTLSGSASGLSLTGSTMFKFDSIVGANLGSVSFTTGAFTSGAAQNGGTFAT